MSRDGLIIRDAAECEGGHRLRDSVKSYVAEAPQQQAHTIYPLEYFAFAVQDDVQVLKDEFLGGRFRAIQRFLESIEVPF
jgi:hypothetical protein